VGAAAAAFSSGCSVELTKSLMKGGILCIVVLTCLSRAVGCNNDQHCSEGDSSGL